MSDWLTDEDRDSLRDAAFEAFGAYPDGLNELVESLIQRHRAEAWNKGNEACCWPAYPHLNPYAEATT